VPCHVSHYTRPQLPVTGPADCCYQSLSPVAVLLLMVAVTCHRRSLLSVNNNIVFYYRRSPVAFTVSFSCYCRWSLQSPVVVVHGLVITVASRRRRSWSGHYSRQSSSSFIVWSLQSPVVVVHRLVITVASRRRSWSTVDFPCRYCWLLSPITVIRWCRPPTFSAVTGRSCQYTCPGVS